MGKTNIDIVHVAHRAIYKKQLENEMAHIIYMGIQFKTGDCSYTTYDFADLIEKHQLPNDDPLTEEQQDNKRKFSDMIANLFKNKLS